MRAKIFYLLFLNFIILESKAQTIDWTKKSNPLLLPINGISFKADGSKVISGTDCHPASIRIFDVNTGTLNWDYTVGDEFMCIMGVTFSSNSKYISAIEEFGHIFIFDNTNELPQIKDTIQTGTSYGFSTTISPDNKHVAIACSNGKLLVYNIADGTQVLSLIAHPSWVTTLAYTSDGNKIISGGSDNRVKIWTNTGSLLYTCIGHTDDISSVKVTPDNKFIVSASKDKQIKVWDISNGELVKTFVGHDNSVNGIDLSPDGSKIVSGSSDGTIKIWNLNTGKMLNTFGKPDSGAVRAVAWSPKGDKIAAGNISSDLMVWSVPEVLGFPTYRMKNEFEFAIYPNPAKNKLTLDFSQDLKISSVEITDMLGRVVYISKGIDSDIQIDSLNTGLYSCKVTTDKGKTAVSTFVKNE